MVEVGLRLHPDKTKIVYCKDSNRRDSHEHTAFTFLGYTFRARGARKRAGTVFTSFAPAISKEALKRISVTVRRWRLDRKTGQTLTDLAVSINPIVRGWLQYYGRFNPSALYRVLQRINTYLMRFLRNKFKRVRGFKKAEKGWQRIIDQHPKTFAHWAWTTTF